MTKALVETIDLPPLKEDYSFHPQTVPGDPIYDRLKVQNPKRLRQILEEEQLVAQYMNTPEMLAIAREAHAQSQAEIRRDFATHGKWWQRHQQAIREHSQATKTDWEILGLNQRDTLLKKDVRNAYRRKARKLHPDVGGDAEAFKQLYVAYRSVLSVTVE